MIEKIKSIGIKKLIIDALITIICIGSMIGVFAYIKSTNKSGEYDSDNANSYVTFKLYYHDNELVIDQKLAFTDGENVYNILDRNYELGIKESVGVGKAILSVNEYTTSWTDDFFAFYVDDEFSNYGVEGVKAKDNMEIKFVWTKLN